MASAYDTIREEHNNIARVLNCLAEMLEQVGRAKDKPDFDVLTLAVYYLRVFPHRYHHRKEDEHLFRWLRRRRPELGAVLDSLEREHEQGDRLLAELSAALDECSNSWPQGCERFVELGREYVQLERDHMRREDTEILPAAHDHLTDDDWDDIAHAFAGHADPLFGDRLETGFHALHQHIVRHRRAGPKSGDS